MTQEERNQLVDKIIDEEKRGQELLPNMGRFAKGYSKFGLRLSTRVFVFTLCLAVCLCYINGPLFFKEYCNTYFVSRFTCYFVYYGKQSFD